MWCTSGMRAVDIYFNSHNLHNFQKKETACEYLICEAKCRQTCLGNMPTTKYELIKTTNLKHILDHCGQQVECQGLKFKTQQDDYNTDEQPRHVGFN